jgi:IS30 family transposase
MKQNWMAQEVGVHPSTFSKELKRNIAKSEVERLVNMWLLTLIVRRNNGIKVNLGL